MLKIPKKSLCPTLLVINMNNLGRVGHELTQRKLIENSEALI